MINIIFAYFFLFFSLAWFLVFGCVFVVFGFNMLLPLIFNGALYVPSKDKEIETMLKLAELEPGEKAVDLGAGDGRIVIALAKKGIEAHGYEINPTLVFKASRAIKKAGLEKLAFMHCSNLWHKNFSPFDVVMIYSLPFAMGRLERKIKKETKIGTKILSNHFSFPHWQPVKKDGRISLYINDN